jgi:hypothetical protein
MRPHTLDEEGALRRRLGQASLMIGAVQLTPAAGGWVVTLHLDSRVVKARAEQQGLSDDSVAAAADNPRVRRALADVIERVNDTLPVDERILRHVLSRIAAP